MTEKLRTFKIRQGEETRPVIEGLEEFRTSIFNEQYIESFAVVENIIRLNKDVKRTRIDMCSNNIVSFIGQRGTGKTSCMMSVVNMLEEASMKGVNGVQSLEFCNEYKLYFLKMIDPSFFDNKHNILELIIGNMYYMYSEEISREGNTLEGRTSYIRDLQESFQKVKHNLIYLNLAPTSALEPLDEELEQLRDLSAGVNLVESIYSLVDSFLKFMGKDLLVINIDDIDLNISEAYTMMEQLRKYFILPNVVILMSLNLDQLRTVIQQSTASKFPDLIKLNVMGSRDLGEMSERYLNKVLPLSSRIYLPSGDSLLNLRIKYNMGEIIDTLRNDCVKDRILEMMNEKCGYRFYNGEKSVNYIIPRNLRELNLLFSLLIGMKKGNMNENRKVFQNYFFNSWVSQLDAPFKVAARKLLSVNDPSLFNKQVINILRELYNDKSIAELRSQFVVLNADKMKEYGDNYDNDLKDIVDENNQAYNISLGDVAYLLNHLLRLETSENMKKFIFYIKTLYTIRLTGYAEYKDFLAYRELIGGAFICLTGTTLIGKENATNVTREIRLVDGDLLNTFIEKVVKRYKEGHGNIKGLRVAEFFMLAISRYASDSKGRSVVSTKNYRLSRDIYYDRDLSNVKNMEFNVLSPIFNCIDKSKTYARFSEEIYEIAKNEPESLVNKLSFVCLTNYEDIEQLFNFLSKTRISGSDTCEVMSKFYGRVKMAAERSNNERLKAFGIFAEMFKNDVLFMKGFMELYETQGHNGNLGTTLDRITRSTFL